MKLSLKFASFGLLLFSCNVQQCEDKILDRQKIEQLARIKLPKSAKDIKVYTESGIDTLIALRFTIDQSELNIFLIDSGYINLLESGLHPFSSKELKKIPWWNPDKASKVTGGVMSNADFASEIMIDISPIQPIVFLKVYDI